MKTKTNLLRSRRLWAIVLLLLGGGLIGLLIAGRQCAKPYCIVQIGEPVTQCANTQPDHTVIGYLPISDSQELGLEGASVARDESSITLSARLKGRFWNESDQNIYIFLGQSAPAAVSYSLSADPQYFTDLSYNVRHTIQLPHSNDIRIGIMAPRPAGYTPQVYITDPVKSDLTGPAAHIEMTSDGHDVRFKLPVSDYYRLKGSQAPGSISVTVATARDYVGFIDQLSVTNVTVGQTKEADQRAQPQAVYPFLNYDSHRFKTVAVQQDSGSVRIMVETNAEINDWAQTNLNFFFVRYPVVGWKHLPTDPSHKVTLPAPWSFFCGVYSPNRFSCKSSNGSDFAYDSGYSERTSLDTPEGVRFRKVGEAKYELELAPAVVEKIKANGDKFALLLTAGRDGFGPTSCYGWNCSHSCNFLNHCWNYLR